MADLKPWLIGTRGSPLALTQTNMVIDLLNSHFTSLSISPKIIKTTGDKITDRPLYEVGGKGLFCKEIETALLNKQVHLAVHSLKDMESFLPEGLIVAGVLNREDPKDAFISTSGEDFWRLPSGSRIGTCSPRRLAQLHYHRADLEYVMIRGNVQTRLEKLHRGEVEALILAYAGLKRLQLDSLITMLFPPSMILPAVGQGVIAIECREEDQEVRSMVSVLNHPSTYLCSLAERQFLKTLGGGCRTPIAGYAFLNKDQTITLKGMIASDVFCPPIYHEEIGTDPYELGERVALHLKAVSAGSLGLML